MEETLTTPGKRPALPTWAWVAIALGLAVSGFIVLGLVATLVVPKVLQKFQFATVSKAKVDITMIESAVKECAIANGGKYPSHLEDLLTPDFNGRTYLQGTRPPRDPWGRVYRYDPPGPDRPLPRVYTYGRDGRPGGEGDDADIDNLSIRGKQLGR
jgi:general secretion pathway protein G